MKQYKTILFDLDDTLLDYTGDEKRCINKGLSGIGLDVKSDIFELYYSIDDWQQFTMGNVNPKTVITDHFRRMLKILEFKESDILHLSDLFYTEMINSHRLKYGALKLLKFLQKKGYKLYITSNGYSEFQRKRIEDSGIEKFFGNIFISEEMDLRKPGKAYFDYVMARIPESNRKNVLLVGDAPTTDVLGGINAGIDTCWLNDKNRNCHRKYTYQVKSLIKLIELL